MNQNEIHARAHQLEGELKDRDALKSNHSAFAKDLEDARRNMTPQEFAALCKEMQHDINSQKGAGDMRDPNHLPVVLIDMSSDGTVKKVDFKQFEFGGDVTNELFIDSSCKEVHQETRSHGLEDQTRTFARLPWWTNVVSWVHDRATADSNEYHQHHDKNGHPVH